MYVFYLKQHVRMIENKLGNKNTYEKLQSEFFFFFFWMRRVFFSLRRGHHNLVLETKQKQE